MPAIYIYYNLFLYLLLFHHYLIVLQNTSYLYFIQ